MLPVAVDAMGGDNAPQAVIAGAKQASEQGIPVLLVGRPEELTDTGGLEVFPASEVIAMDAEPGSSVRTLKDSTQEESREDREEHGVGYNARAVKRDGDHPKLDLSA